MILITRHKRSLYARIAFLSLFLISNLNIAQSIDNKSNSAAKRGVFKTGVTNSKIINDDGATQRGVDRSYSETGNIIKDNITSLEWQKGSSSSKMNWLAAADYCNNKSTNGATWRVPSKKELLSIVDLSRRPTINSIFSGTKSDYHWTSTSLVHTPNRYAFFVRFNDGASITQGFRDEQEKSKNYYVKCVRGDDVRDDFNFVRDNTKETVTESSTELMWEDSEHVKELVADIKVANTYCSNLTLGGYNDWYLPNINELRTIADENRYDPGINSAFINYVTFGSQRELHGPKGGNYWSSTHHSSGNTFEYYRTFDFQSGGNARCRWYLDFQVRCVRDSSSDALSNTEFDVNSLNITAYPNPTLNGQTTISLPEKYTTVSLEIYDINGKSLSKENYTNTSSIKLNMNYASGTYFVKLKTNTKKTGTIKLIKK